MNLLAPRGAWGRYGVTSMICSERDLHATFDERREKIVTCLRGACAGVQARAVDGFSIFSLLSIFSRMFYLQLGKFNGCSIVLHLPYLMLYSSNRLQSLYRNLNPSIESYKLYLLKKSLIHLRVIKAGGVIGDAFRRCYIPSSRLT